MISQIFSNRSRWVILSCNGPDWEQKVKSGSQDTPICCSSNRFPSLQDSLFCYLSVAGTWRHLVLEESWCLKTVDNWRFSWRQVSGVAGTWRHLVLEESWCLKTVDTWSCTWRQASGVAGTWTLCSALRCSRWLLNSKTTFCWNIKINIARRDILGRVHSS